MKRAIVLGITAAAIAATGCSEARSENGGPMVDRDYQVGGFDRIELAGGGRARPEASGEAASISRTGF